MNVRLLHALWRTLSLLVGAAVLAGGLALLALALDVLPSGRVLWGGGGIVLAYDLDPFPLRERWLWAGAAVLVALAGLAVLWLAVAPTADAVDRSRRVRLQGRSNGLGGGEVTVAMEGLHSLVAHEAERDPAVREAVPSLKLGRKGWKLGCRVLVGPDAAVPDVAARLRRTLVEAVERHTGLPVARADLDVRLFPADARQRVR